MTTTIIPSGSESLRVLKTPTGSAEVVPFNSEPLRVYDLRDQRNDDLPLSGIEDEFDINSYAEEQDEVTQAGVNAAGAWVADTLYPGEPTLAALRLRAGLSQAAFALQCGLQQPHVSRYEAGKHEPGVFQAQTMASVLGVSLEVLVKALKQSAGRSE